MHFCVRLSVTGLAPECLCFSNSTPKVKYTEIRTVPQEALGAGVMLCAKVN